jgi:putative MATE family efflux protein
VSHPLLTAPLGRSLFRLAGPTTLIMLVQVGVALAETWFLARLGTTSLAGAALVVPFITMMHNMAAGGMGGGVASAMARALGAGRTEDARVLVPQALLLGAAIALLFTLFGWLAGPPLYRVMGGDGAVLGEALAFSALWSVAAPFVWANFFLAAMLRGGGDAVTPARISLALSALYVPVCGALMLATPLGIAGLPLAAILSNIASIVLLGRALRRGVLGFAPSTALLPLRWPVFGEILRVGVPGSVTTIVAAATALLVTGLVGQCGTAALAGWGIALRLEFMLAPVAFGIGSGATTLVGIATGAGDWRRAVRAAWTAGLAAFLILGTAGWIVALLPESWSRLFSADPEVIAASVACLTRTAPVYCLFGLGLALNFAGQGAGRMTVPVVASFARFAVWVVGGAWVLRTFGLNGVFGLVAISLAIYGLTMGGALLVRPWRGR